MNNNSMEYSKSGRKRPTFEVSDAGKFGKDIYTEIIKGVTYLKPVSGTIRVEVELRVEDNNIFKDDEVRNAKLIVEVLLEDR